MTTEIAKRDDVRALVAESQQILSTAKEFKIATNVSYQLAGEELKKIKGAAKRLEDLRTSITKPMDAAKKAVMDLFRDPSDWLANAERVIKGAMVAYQEELQRQAREERERAEAAARAEQERLAAASARAAERGEMERADSLQAQAEAVQPVAIVREAPKVSGISFREVWKFEITDPAAIPREYLTVDETKIRRVVQAMKADAKIPGVRVFSDKQPAASAA
jgi:hypothetical protein